MSDQIAYNQSHLQQGIADLRAAKQAMGSAKDAMEREVKAILGETWTGSSHEAYQATMREWAQSMQRMEEIAHAMESTLGTMSENYSTTQRNVTNMWS